jgi:hypothetical protein
MPAKVVQMVSCGAYLIASCLDGFVYRLAPGPGYWHSAVRLADVPQAQAQDVGEILVPFLYGWKLTKHGNDVFGHDGEVVMRVFEGDR